jgi:hypothetical protein
MKPRTKTTPPPPPAPVSAADQARFDAVTRCRQRVDDYKREGVDPHVLELAVEELQAAVAAAPDMPPPPPPPAPVEDEDPDADTAPTASPVDADAPAGSEQEN